MFSCSSEEESLGDISEKMTKTEEPFVQGRLVRRALPGGDSSSSEESDHDWMELGRGGIL